ncbi:MAG: SiaB family protein kinase [Desulfohalobiaceae bacterium]|nr:SiaB family protein kinase [Desulfohalobiaceae bacterium]
MDHHIQTFYEQLKEKGIVFSFTGPVSQSLLEGIGETLRQKMTLEETSTTVTHKVFSIFVELMQNVINYSAEKGSGEYEQDLSFGIMIIGKQDAHFYIQCGNYITEDQEGPLTEKLRTIQSMNKDELKKYYKEQRRKETPDASKGAGLGFIEMARKATRPLSFEVVPSEAGKHFFVVTAVV